MTKYKCGHRTEGIIVADSNPLSISEYFEWAENEGVLGTKELCPDCWEKRHKKNLSFYVRYKEVANEKTKK